MRRIVPLPLVGLALAAACGAPGQRAVVIGSKNFTEQIVLAELVAQQIERRAGLRVERRTNLGGTLICHRALAAGELDLYVEYTGTALMAILDEPPGSDPREVYRRVRDAYRDRFDLEWGEPLGFSNTFAMVVRGEDARRLGLTSISDVARRAPDWRAGFGYEFSERPDGLGGLVERYGLRFAEPPRTMDLGLIYRSLRAGRVDIVAGNSTDGLIEALDLAVLEDDLGYFPPYEAAPVVRRDTLAGLPALGPSLRELGGAITEEAMRRMNYAVDGQGQDAAAVARRFLETLGP
ncbi:MAG: glycine betaine ABC transporter substrate-binding protein [Acidobacteriota bacterium]